MKRIWTDKELNEELKKITIIADTREKENAHITKWFDEKEVPHISRKLDVGDYSAQIENGTLEKEIVIERKANLEELCVNMTTERDRFEREFQRAHSKGIKIYLLIEDATMNDICLGNYRSNMKPQSLIASIFSWMIRYDVTTLFCSKQNSGRIIMQLLYYAMREDLLSA